MSVWTTIFDLMLTILDETQHFSYLTMADDKSALSKYLHAGQNF
jgi:hypothetical protein